jgi:glutamyl-tRNA reductase
VEPPPAESTAWRTCLREIHFLPGHLAPRETGVLTDAAAYALLLEIVCGLRSPLLGETEVQAQFKAFLDSVDGGGASGARWIRRVGQRILGDAKRIRHKHLQGFGAHSYGHLAARYIIGSRVSVIGGGALAAQVVNSAPATSIVDVWARSAERVVPVRASGLNFSLLAEAPAHRASRQEPATVIVAAPVTSVDLDAVVACYSALANIVDLRASDQQSAIASGAPVTTLADLFADVTRTDATGFRLGAARADIHDLAQAFAGREELRPFGWDDVCA